jgi:uncharacterized membrane protein YvbJ
MQNKTFLLIIVLVFFSSSCQAPRQGSLFSEQGSVSKDTVVDKYIEALQKGDKQSIESLVPKGLNSKQVIANRIKAYSNRTIEVKQICYEFGDKTSIVKASIHGDLIVNATGQKKNFTEIVTLLGQAGGWFLGLGTPKPVTTKNKEKTAVPVTKPK